MTDPGNIVFEHAFETAAMLACMKICNNSRANTSCLMIRNESDRASTSSYSGQALMVPIFLAQLQQTASTAVACWTDEHDILCSSCS